MRRTKGRIGMRACLALLGAVCACVNSAPAVGGADPVLQASRRRAEDIPAWTPADWGVGGYVWAAQIEDKQTCRLWRSFEIPPDAVVTGGRLRILADNSFVVMLDGRVLGRGSDYLYLTEYVLDDVLAPGRHAIAVEAFNETYEAGVVVGLQVDLLGREPLRVMSDTSWQVVPAGERGWERRLDAAPHWEAAVEIAGFGEPPWDRPPKRVLEVLVKPVAVPAFWQRGWFQALVAAAGGTAAVGSLVLAMRLGAQSRDRTLLDRERARIARDIHDELGTGLTQLVLEAEVARTDLPPGSEVGRRLDALCTRARALGSSMDELVWAVNSRRDTLRDFVAFASKHVRRFLEPTGIRCRLDVADGLPDVFCDLHVRRNLLLAVKEAVNNAVKHAAASRICLKVERRPRSLLVSVEDDGSGFDLARVTAAGNGLGNLHERLEEIGGRCRITTAPGKGCLVEFELPFSRFVRGGAAPVRRIDPLGIPSPGITRSAPTAEADS